MGKFISVIRIHRAPCRTTTELPSFQFDYCERDKPFATIVIPAAATSPTLLNAILAVSARHLSITQGFDRYAADKYQHECLKTLIPALANPEVSLDDKLFAATVILRFFNEMTGNRSNFLGALPQKTKDCC